MNRPRRIIVVGNTGWNLIRFRGGLLRALSQGGWDVWAAASVSEDQALEVRSLGASPISVPLEASGTHPLRDLRYFRQLVALYHRATPDVVHHFTIKPVIYGSIAARLCRVPIVVNTITGLGVATTVWSGALGYLIRALYRVALSGPVLTSFQNFDDRRKMVQAGLIKEEKTCVIPGSGVDTRELSPTEEERVPADEPSFVLVCRMLWTKGVREFVEAAAIVKRSFPKARFVMVGGSRSDYSSANSAFVPLDWLNDVGKNGVVQWLGFLDPPEVAETMRKATAVVLPSHYGEGCPRSLLEALALGRPVVATDVPGCREVVRDGVNGMLVPVREVEPLANAFVRFLEEPKLIERMGKESRRLAERRFDAKRVFAAYCMMYEGELPQDW